MLFQADRLPSISPYGHFNHNHLVRRSLINTTIRSLPDATFISPVRSSFRYNLSSETAHRQATFSFLLGLLPQFHSSPCRPSIATQGDSQSARNSRNKFNYLHQSHYFHMKERNYVPRLRHNIQLSASSPVVATFLYLQVGKRVEGGSSSLHTFKLKSF